jgi:hypothetical protein
MALRTTTTTATAAITPRIGEPDVAGSAHGVGKASSMRIIAASNVSPLASSIFDPELTGSKPIVVALIISSLVMIDELKT